jgi:hypothetical protein
MNHDERRAIAIWRMSVLGPLVSARLEHGELRPLLEAAAARTYETPGGRRVRPGWRTIEAWHYAYQRGGLSALEPTPRNDAGTCRALPEALAQHILALRREQPRRSVRTLIRAVERAGMCRTGETSASSVLRLLRAHGLSQRPSATPAHERRPFLPEHPGDLKQALVSLVDERGIVPVIVLDDAQGLRDELLRELHGLTSLDFDGRDYLTVWLVGHPLLARRLRLQQHAALAQRIVWYAPMFAKTDPQLFGAMLDHGLTAAVAPSDLITSDARDLILRVSRGIPRLISHLLRISLVLADERGLSSIDVSVVNSAAIVLHLESTRPPVVPPPKPRFDRDSRSRG